MFSAICQPGVVGHSNRGRAYQRQPSNACQRFVPLPLAQLVDPTRMSAAFETRFKKRPQTIAGNFAADYPRADRKYVRIIMQTRQARRRRIVTYCRPHPCYTVRGNRDSDSRATYQNTEICLSRRYGFAQRASEIRIVNRVLAIGSQINRLMPVTGDAALELFLQCETRMIGGKNYLHQIQFRRPLRRGHNNLVTQGERLPYLGYRCQCDTMDRYLRIAIVVFRRPLQRSKGHSSHVTPARCEEDSRGSFMTRLNRDPPWRPAKKVLLGGSGRFRGGWRRSQHVGHGASCPSAHPIGCIDLV